MPEEQVASIPESTVKKTGFVFGGILIGLVFVVLFLFIFNYLRVISLSSFYSRFSILPQRELSVEEKAKKAGYSIIWQGDKNDTTGRTVLASKDRVKDIGFPDQFGYINHKVAVIGIFKSFKKIPSSEDYYMVLEDPINKQQIKIRISTKVHSVDTSDIRFSVDNLYLIAFGNTPSVEKLFDYTGSKADLQKIEKIVKQGDIIYAALHTTLIGNKTIGQGEIKDSKITKDENGVIYADAIILRRFGGKEQIDKELVL